MNAVVEVEEVEPVLVPWPKASTVLDEVRRQYLNLSKSQQRRFRQLLREAARLDGELGTLRLVLPVVQIEFYGLLPLGDARFHPEELLRALET